MGVHCAAAVQVDRQTDRQSSMLLNCLSMYSSTLLKPITTKLNVGLANFPIISTSCLPKFTCNLNITFDHVAAITHNKVIIAAGVSAAIGQVSKPFTGVVLYGRPFDIKAFIQAGGFPSTHSSAVVATATCLALERGFSDSIFGMAAVYAALFMYDAQGVRREVGIQAKTLNKLLQEYQTKPITDVSKDIVNSGPGKPASTNLESSTSLEEPSASKKEQNVDNLTNYGTVGKESEKTPRFPRLKESIGHTEVEVIAGALLGLLVGLTVNVIM
ncbi:hypothetical protein RND81_10G180100 [Saponaria officinalis]|uniref:Acid phosphatase/vanadium-dependent haloperoxidase-related protein n=1 Tax=Saponaria officinalis TaxID=3572 RepID=A0AAW1I495_SAPOF